MRNRQIWLQPLALLLLYPALVFAEGEPSPPSAQQLYQQHCQQCHGAERLGGMGPALLPENLQRLRPNEAIQVIAQGRAATQMPAFSQTLSEQDIARLTDFIYQPPAQTPVWEMSHIQASHQVLVPADQLADTPQFKADMMNLFVVVELGDHHATILDGDTFTPIHRFKTHFALHGGPKYSPDGRYVYFASRDGWISKFDLYNLKTVAEVRAGINTRNLAVSSDGRYAIAANYLPNNLVLLDTRDLSPIRIIDAIDQHGTHSRVSAVYNAPSRHSFIAAMKDIKEVWEIRYTDKSQIDPGKAQQADDFPVTRIPVSTYLDDFFFDKDYRVLLGASREGASLVLDLDTQQEIAKLDIPGMPHLGSGITWNYQGKTVMATPNLKEGIVTVFDTETWQVVKRIETLGPGFFMRSHEQSRYAWVDVFFGPNRDAVHVIDKATLEIVKTLRPAPGKTAAHVEFTKDGRYALLSIWELDGAIVVYDAKTLEEVKRLPMVKPSGKYNVYNKIHYEEGTSH